MDGKTFLAWLPALLTAVSLVAGGAVLRDRAMETEKRVVAMEIEYRAHVLESTREFARFRALETEVAGQQDSIKDIQASLAKVETNTAIICSKLGARCRE